MVSVTLQSKEHQELLDVVEILRSRGISRSIHLPKIVVCGDQSAGKSSVLEAISGIAFPTTDNFGTRFATELVLRRDAIPSAKASIITESEGSATGWEHLDHFTVELDPVNPDMGRVIREAKEAMGLSEEKAFSTDILRIELCGPNQPHFTMVDLPGLFRDGNRGRSDEDKIIVGRIVRSYMNQHRNIILAISAKSDFNLQEVTEMARELNLNGPRTLGLIKKPDVLDAGSDNEAAYVELAQNKDVVFRLGWHTLKIRDYEMRDATSAERDEAEERFLKTEFWANMNPTQLGVKSLITRLSNVLEDQILRQIPTLLRDVKSEISACKMQLQQLEAPCTTDGEQLKYVLQVSRKFSTLMKSAVDGDYNDPFFGKAKMEDGYRRRLRARVRNALADFEEEMRVKGEYRRIVNSESPDEKDGMPWINRSTYRNEVNDLITRSRGRDLPGTLNPAVVSELFAEQCQRWEKIAATVQENILQIVYEVTHDIVEQVTVEETAKDVLQTISAALEPLKRGLHDKFDELLKPHRERHPILLNDYLKNSVQELQSDRRRQQLLKEFKKRLEPKSFDTPQVLIKPQDFFEPLEENTAVDMEHYGSELAIDYMSAYYELAMKKFINDSVLAVEQCLISELPSVFLPEYILDLNNDQIFWMANKSKSDRLERDQCTEKLAVLEVGKSDLERLESYISNSDILPHEEDQGIITADYGSEASLSASG